MDVLFSPVCLCRAYQRHATLALVFLSFSPSSPMIFCYFGVVLLLVSCCRIQQNSCVCQQVSTIRYSIWRLLSVPLLFSEISYEYICCRCRRNQQCRYVWDTHKSDSKLMEENETRMRQEQGDCGTQRIWFFFLVDKNWHVSIFIRLELSKWVSVCMLMEKHITQTIAIRSTPLLYFLSLRIMYMLSHIFAAHAFWWGWGFVPKLFQSWIW